MADENKSLTDKVANIMESVANEGVPPDKQIKIEVVETKGSNGEKTKKIRASGSRAALRRAKMKLSDLTTLTKIKSRLGYVLNKEENKRKNSVAKMISNRKTKDGKPFKIRIAPKSVKEEYAGKKIAGYNYQGKRVRHNNELSKSAHDKYSNVMSEVWRQVNDACQKTYGTSYSGIVKKAWSKVK
jgi:hypothetical protein